MRVEQLTRDDGTVVPHYIAEEGEHLLVTGPISGIKELSDGTQVNVTPHVVALETPDQVTELNHLIAMEHVANGHPDDVDVLTDPDNGRHVVVQRPFIYDDHTGKRHVGVGTPVGEHPLDYQLREHTDKEAAAGDKAYRALKAKNEKES